MTFNAEACGSTIPSGKSFGEQNFTTSGNAACFPSSGLLYYVLYPCSGPPGVPFVAFDCFTDSINHTGFCPGDDAGTCVIRRNQATGVPTTGSLVCPPAFLITQIVENNSQFLASQCGSLWSAGDTFTAME